MNAMFEKFSDAPLLNKGVKAVRSMTVPKALATYQEWRQLAEQKDRRSRMDEWRERDKTSLYDYKAIQNRFRQLKDLRQEGNDRGLLYALHEGVHGNMAGMGRAALYNQSKLGTKRLIEEYIEEIVTSLDHIDQVSEKIISRDEKLAFFRRVDHCFGRSALMLSGGALLGYFHYGVVKAMFEQNVLPTVISGSSAGSITAAVLGTHTDEELKTVFSPGRLLLDVEYEVSLLKRFLQPRGDRLDEQQVAETIAHLVPDLTFEEAFKKTGRHINIPVAPARQHQTSRLLNNITSPHVYIRSAVMASCAVPGVFEPVQLRAKNFNGGSQDYLPGRKWVDGSMDDDLPAKRLSRLYGVNHYIASQVNPHVLPFLSHPESKNLLDALSRPYKAFAQEWLKSAQLLGSGINLPIPRRLRMAADLLYHVSTQKYTADISILLNPRHIAPLRLLSKPTAVEVEKLIRAGERATWPVISRIDNSLKISRAVERILADYQPRL
jgi:NTE family protein